MYNSSEYAGNNLVLLIKKLDILTTFKCTLLLKSIKLTTLLKKLFICFLFLQKKRSNSQFKIL